MVVAVVVTVVGGGSGRRWCQSWLSRFIMTLTVMGPVGVVPRVLGRRTPQVGGGMVGVVVVVGKVEAVGGVMVIGGGPGRQ